ncbi:hypothetical protein J6590_011944 [Homalodisca vitripennis]|nr:hypothetical protein J6590_011944 [Homalodisca vitripennis]
MINSKGQTVYNNTVFRATSGQRQCLSIKLHGLPLLKVTSSSDDISMFDYWFSVLEPEEDMSEYSVPERDEQLSVEVVEEWYRNRVYQLEQYSNMVDQPLELVKLARERNIKGLDCLFSELVTLDVLVYDVGMDGISLRDLEVMSHLQKAQSLMSESNEDNFVENLRHRLVPFLQRCERLQSLSRRQLLSQFLSEISSKGLRLPLKMFDYCTKEPHNLIIPETEELIVLALDSVYSYQDTDQLSVVDTILRILPTSSLGTSAAELFDRVEAAQSELRVAVILRGRGHPLNLHYIHSHRADMDAARALFLDLSTTLGNRVPAASDTDWNQLLQDLLQMQNLVFTCVPLNLCYEVYTVAVLASGNSAVVRTAVRSLCCHSEERDRKPLSLQRSVELVLQAATNYFDAAASLTDPNIRLAKSCLNLITEDNPEIQEEKDLITALQLLNEFKINLLPLQVRLCTERMRLIESCLMSRPTAYKDHHKLLSLAHKLRICGKDSRQREGTILVRVANIAFEARDYQHCAEICQQLMERRHAIGWEITQQLGQCGEFWDLATRRRLIAFALIHCPDDKVQELMESRCELEYKRLQTFIYQQTGTTETPSEDEEFLDAVTSPQSPTKEFLPQLSSTLHNTSKLLTQLTKTGFWKEKLLHKDNSKDMESRRKADPSMSLQGFPEFYSSLHDRCHQSVLSADYSGEDVVDWRQYQLMQAILQASLLQQEKLPRHLLRDMDNVLVHFASLLLPEDSCVGLATLLSLSKPEASDQCFSCLPLTELTLQLAVYFLALLQTLRHDQQAFLWTPDQVLAWAMNHSDDMAEGSQLLTKALIQLKNFEQSKRVEQLNCGVNVRRFAWDEQYKIDSILGLAMCEEREKLQAALQLGSTHGVEGWEIVFSHVRSLLLSNSNSLSERLGDNRLTQLLRDQSEAVVKKLQESVLPALSGTNHSQLISYYTVLQAVAPSFAVNGLVPRDHVKLIKKVKATSSEIDYVRLVTKPSEVMEALKPAVRKDTIASVAKLVKELLKTLPQLQGHITVGGLYADWAVVQFKAECLSATCRQPLEQFEALRMYFQKMSAADLLSFVKRAIFCHQSVLKLDVDTREAMIDVVLNCGRQQHLTNENPDFLKIQELKDYLLQVWYLERDSSKNIRNYLVRLDEACGDSDAISTIIQTALLDASVSTHVLQKIAKLSNKKALSSYITDLLHSLPSQASFITTILQRVEDCLAHGEKGDSWSILIGPLTERTELPTSIRKQAAQISQRLGANYNEELEALRLRTEAVLRTPVKLSQVCDQNSRYLMFKHLLSQSDSWDTLQQLSLLLSTWPDVDTSWYLELIETMAEVSNGEKFLTLQRIFRKNVFEEEEVAHLISRLEDCSDGVFTITLCLIPEFKRLHLKGAHLLRKLPSETLISKELARRVVETELLGELVQSPIFLRIKEVLLQSSKDLCERAADQLIAANCTDDAIVFQQASTCLS